MSKIIAIIPARSGSKRIKNKNIIKIFGKPMIAWTIIAAKKSKLFDKVLVSTDSNKIAKIAKKYNITGFPVVNKANKVLGILTNRDIRFLEDNNVRVGDIMTKENLKIETLWELILTQLRTYYHNVILFY